MELGFNVYFRFYQLPVESLVHNAISLDALDFCRIEQFWSLLLGPYAC